MSEHVITLLGPLPYPGGKDNFYVASCSCGKYASVRGSKENARRDGAQHAQDKEAADA